MILVSFILAILLVVCINMECVKERVMSVQDPRRKVAYVSKAW